ncbi:MAG: nucleotidyl transferase AbiEii/AbiGii toxin family protein [Euzebya sp.]
MPDPVELDAERIIEVLNRHGVDYVVIGGFAAVLHGSPRTTADIDITPSAERSNLLRLGAALTELAAKLMPPGATAGVDWPWTAEGFAAFTTMTTRTSAGDLDICLRPDAPGGRQYQFDDLAARAIVISLPPDVPVASLADVIASKEASGRDKDLLTLPHLRDLLLALEAAKRDRDRS